MNPKVSVIVPCFNIERYVDQCIRSLLGQTLDDIEIIAVNDASTDMTGTILRRLEREFKEKLRVVDSAENRCTGGARNLGVAAARGEFIAFVDGDDSVDPTMFESMLRMAESTGSEVVDCDYLEVGRYENERVRVTSLAPGQCGILDDHRRRSLILNPGPLWTKLFRRSFWDENGLSFPEGVIYGEDTAILWSLACAKKIAKVSEHFYLYRVNPGSITSKRNNLRVLERLDSARAYRAGVLQNGIYTSFACEFDQRFIERFYVWPLGACLFGFRKPPVGKMEEMRAEVKETVPEYRRNPYFRGLPFYARAATKMNDICPSLLGLAVRTARSPWVDRALRMASNRFRRSDRLTAGLGM